MEYETAKKSVFPFVSRSGYEHSLVHREARLSCPDKFLTADKSRVCARLDSQDWPIESEGILCIRSLREG